MIATAASTSTVRRVRGISPRTALAGLLFLVLALIAQTALAAPAEALTGVDLSTYKRVGRFDLPEPTRTTPPADNLLGQEASGVAYNWDTDSLFIVGDGGTSVTQVSKTGALIDTMTLPPGGSPQGTEFYDTEGIAYLGNEEFVMTEERDRRAVHFTYEPGGTLTREEADTVTLGTEIGNVGLEDVTNDPVTGGYIFVKESDPRSIFQTGIDWDAGTATNGGPTTVASTDLFAPALTGLVDLSGVFALANLSTMTGPQTNHLLIISQESGKVINVDRSGTVSSSLTLVNDAGNPLSIQQQTHEGVTMDDDGVLYTVSEAGGGDSDHPQLWVFEPSSEPNQAPTAVSLANQTASLPEGTNTSTRLKVADIVLTDDGLGTNEYSVTGADASHFEADSAGLYLKAGTVLNAATKSAYQVSVQVEDKTVSGSSPVTSSLYTLTVISAGEGSGASMAVTEVAPWGSSDGAYKADWFELTNIGVKAVDLTGWKIDDDSASFASAVALSGVTSLAPGESAVFMEDDPDPTANMNAFKSQWFGGSPPVGFKIGTYSDSSTGLSAGGDQVHIFNAAGTRVTGVAFGASTVGRTFDNTAALGSATIPLPAISTLSTAGVSGAFTVGSETGSPGVAPVKTPVIVSEVAPWGSGFSEYTADWWELTNTSGQALDLTGWKFDDESNSFGSGVALNGVTSLAPGESAIFVEGDSAKVALFKTSWFGASPPAGLQVGSYSGSSIGLGTGGDQVNVFNAVGSRLTGVSFGSATTNVSFNNAAGLGSFTSAPAISTLSVEGVNGAFKIHDQVGSPGKTAGPPPPPNVKITEVSSTSSSNSTYKADWWELTNTGATTVDPSTYKVDDDSSAFGSALALTGVTSLAPGESAIFLEGTASTADTFKSHWFGASPPAGLQVGSYSGSGIGFGSGGDQVNLFDSAGAKITGVRFGAASTGVSFDNAAAVGSTETPPPLISALSAVGVNGAFAAGGEVGSPGTIVQPPEFALTVSRVGAGSGIVESSPAGIDCGVACSAEFGEGSTVKLTAEASAGSEFREWSGACSGKDACEVTMSEAKSVNAFFAHEKQVLTIDKSGNGKVTSSKTKGIRCTAVCSQATAALPEGTVVTLTAKPGAGATFTGWSGGAGTCTGTTTPCEVE
ncbi:MAG TPA: lamin tail domain-containing protein, partial [Solirubrobacterales bacterium]|nr:lamin tail domain-containing protein [Solirubrobacterales bacterium]